MHVIVRAMFVLSIVAHGVDLDSSAISCYMMRLHGKDPECRHNNFAKC